MAMNKAHEVTDKSGSEVLHFAPEPHYRYTLSLAIA